MAGDPLHAAFFDHLKAQLDECGLPTPTWLVLDTRNTRVRPGVRRYIDFEILPSSNDQYTTGAPGSNLHRETGQITIRFKIPTGDEDGQEEAGRYGDLLMKRFLYLGARFDCDGRSVRLISPLRMGFGEDEDGLWVETMAVAYEQFLVG